MNQMMDAAEEQESNVIQMNFKTGHSSFENAALGPIDDPLSDLLHEFDDLIDEGPCDEQKDFIFHLNEEKKYQIKHSDGPVEMTEVLMNQTKRLLNDIQRLTYYLDEMYIDK